MGQKNPGHLIFHWAYNFDKSEPIFQKLFY